MLLYLEHNAQSSKLKLQQAAGCETMLYASVENHIAEWLFFKKNMFLSQREGEVQHYPQLAQH